MKKLAVPTTQMLFLVILTLVVGAFSYKFVNLLQTATKLQKEPSPEQQLISKIQQEVLIPFCETEGQFTLEDLKLFLAVDLRNAIVDGDLMDWKTVKPHTAKTWSEESYDFMFSEKTNFSTCADYFKRLKQEKIKPYEPNNLNDVGYADYVYSFKPSDSIKITVSIKLEDSKMKIRSISYEEYVTLPK